MSEQISRPKFVRRGRFHVVNMLSMQIAELQQRGITLRTVEADRG
jgi:hypothetical protein